MSVVRLELKDIDSGFLSRQSEEYNWLPDRPDDVWIDLNVTVGLADDEAADVFYVTACTPEALRHAKKTNQHDPTRVKYLLLRDYSFERLQELVEGIVADCAGQDWESSVTNLQKHFVWEYGLPK